MSDDIIVEIDEETIAQFEALPAARAHSIMWTAQQDALLLKYWPIKRHTEVARLIGACQDSCRKRYGQLTGD